MGCTFTLEKSGPVRVLRLEGADFAMPQLVEFRNVLGKLMDDDLATPLALDTTGLEFLGSCCLSGIIDYALGFRKRSATLFLIESRPDILDVFEVASLGSILPIYGSVEEAVLALGII